MNAISIDKSTRVLFILLLVTGLAWTPNFSAAAAGNNQIVGWGYNYFGQAAAPADLSDVIAIAAGSYHNLAINRDGTVIAWGDDDYGNLNIPAGLSGVIAADVSFHNLALKNDGTVIAWGYNSGGQTNVPAGLADVVAVAAGSIHSLALKSDGTVVAWGFGGFGQSDIPAGLTDVIAIDEGAKHSIALRNDGTVVAWGNNDHGQSNVPAGLSDVKAVAAGDYHNLALKSDGTVVAWGINFSGQTNVPLGLNGVIMVSAGADHSLALKSDGTVVAWGGGSSGQATVPAGLAGVISISAGKSHSLALVAPAPPFNPLIFVEPNEDNVYALNWTDGTILTVTIDDPVTIGIMDYTGTMIAVAAQDWDHGLKLGDIFDIKPGYIVTLSGEGITKQHTVTHLTVMDVDIDADTVSGIAYPGSRLHVGTLCDENGCAHRNVTVDQDGTWLVDFSDPVSDPNDGSGLFDIRLGDGNSVYEGDEDGDNTKVDWYLPNPHFSVIFPKNEIHGYEWPMGANITLTIDDPSNGTAVDYSKTKTVGAENFRPPFGTWIGFSGDFTVKPGDIVTMTDGTTTKTHVTQELTVTNVDLVADTIAGTAAPGTDVGVNGGCDNNGCVYRNVPVDASGHWLADFSVPGDQNNEQQILDIRLGSSGHAERTDDDGDGTVYDWSLGDPRIFALLGEQRVHAWGWLAGTPLTLTIDNPATTQSPDYTGTQEATAIEDWDYGADWGIAYDIQPGYLVTVSGGGVTKELTVAHLTVTTVDIEADTVSGTGDPGYEIHVGLLCDDTSCTRRNIYVDATGNWFADFSVQGHDDDETVFDIRYGSGTGVYQIDEDSDATSVGWNVPNHTFGVRANGDWIQGFEWIVGSTITIEIDDPATLTDPDFTDAATVGVADWDPSQSYFGIQTEGYDLKLGDLVTVSDGDITKQLLITDFKITDVDLDNDIVHGEAVPNQNVDVWTCWQDVPCVNRNVRADQNGNWSENFGIAGDEDWEQETSDLRAGSWIDSSARDDDGDTVMFGWYVPIPNIEANPGNDWVVARGWTNGTVLTLTIDDPSNGLGVDKTLNITMGPSSWDPNDIAAATNPMNDFDLQPGHIIKVTDGITEVTYIPTNLTVTGFDLEAETISGIALPGVEVEVWVEVPGSHVLRYVTSDALTGNWMADFGHVGQRDDEQQLVDLQPGTEGFVKEFDSNSNATHTDWRVPHPPLFMLNVDNESHWRGLDAWNWPLGSQVTLSVNDPNAAQNPVYTEVQTMMEGNGRTHAMYLQDDNFDGQPGFTITLSDGIQTKSMIVPILTITSYDLNNDTITGISDPFKIVTVPAGRGSEYAERTVQADGDGHWLADFAVSNNPDEVIFDVRFGDDVEPQIFDEDQDHTVLRNWRVPNNQSPDADAGPDQSVYVLDLVMLDASASSDPDGDTITYAWDLNNDGQYNDVNGVTVATTFTQPGTYTVGLLVMDDGGLSSTDTVTITVLPWTLRGFYQPVDMNGVYNLVKRGSTVPLKFEIFAGPTELTDITSVKGLTYAPTSCETNAITDEVEVIATGNTMLRYDATAGQFIYNWKTPNMPGQCFRVTMTSMDGSSLVAYFKLK